MSPKGPKNEAQRAKVRVGFTGSGRQYCSNGQFASDVHSSTAGKLNIHVRMVSSGLNFYKMDAKYHHRPVVLLTIILYLN